jgi:Uma2 family endonuclease
MASTTSVLTIADLLEQFGPIPASRIRHDPPPGATTEKDVIEIEAREDRLYELIDGVLVEKAMGYYEAYLASLLGRLIGNYAEEHDLGIVAGADGTLRLFPQQVRIPDVSFVCWERLPEGRLPAEPIPQLVPDLAIEVISQSNTDEEMTRKLHEYFQAGVRLVWYVYPESRSVRVYRNPNEVAELSGEDVLDGDEVLPGYRLPLAQLFATPKQSDG